MYIYYYNNAHFNLGKIILTELIQKSIFNEWMIYLKGIMGFKTKVAVWIITHKSIFFQLTVRLITLITVSVQFSCSVVSDSLRPHESQHTRPPCPSPSPRVCPNPRPSSRWCHPAISTSVVPFSSCPQSLPAIECFPVSQRFTSGGQSTGVSALASFLPKKSQGWSPSEWTGWISL